LAKTTGASELESRVASVGGRLGRAIPFFGWGIATAGVGYDIHTGKDPGKAIFSGLAGATGATVVGSMVGGPIGLAAGAAVAAGIAVGLGADWFYDHVVPDGVKTKIDEGLRAVRNSIGDAGRAIGDTAKGVWSIF